MHWIWLSILVPMFAHADDFVAKHVHDGNVRALQKALIEISAARLRTAGLVLDAEHAWLGLSRSLPAGEWEVRPKWSEHEIKLPLTFELRPAVAIDTSVRPILATLAVKLQRSVLVAARRLRKGSRVACGDVSSQLRDILVIAKAALTTCEVPPDTTALRDIAVGDVLREKDLGPAPDVAAGAPVRVSVSSGSINVVVIAVALADAHSGDQIDVRLQRPTRTLRTRVTGPGTVQLLDEAP